MPGNEAADRAAKEAAGHRGQQGPYLDDEGPVPTRSAVDCWIKARTNEAWKEDWTGSKHGAALRQLLPHLDKSSLEIYSGMTRAESTVMIQLQTGKIAFNGYLKTIGAVESNTCQICQMAPQSIRHVLMNYSALDKLRHTVWSSNTPGNGIPTTLATFLTDMKHVRRTAQFVLQTGLISYLKETVEPPAHATDTPVA